MRASWGTASRQVRFRGATAILTMRLRASSGTASRQARPQSAQTMRPGTALGAAGLGNAGLGSGGACSPRHCTHHYCFRADGAASAGAQPPSSVPRPLTDIHVPETTVLEALQFSAALCLSTDVTAAQRTAFVQEVCGPPGSVCA